MTEKLNLLAEQMETMKKEMVKTGAAIFKEVAADLFAKYPEVNSFSWKQYTPYFNDGDECVFHTHEVDEINGFDEYSKEDATGNIYKKYSYDESKSDPRAFEIVKALVDFINAVPSEVLKDTFGDHSKITVHRDAEVKVEEYEHG